MLLAAGAATDLLNAFLQGAPPGAVYALLALGLVLNYKTSGVFNLALGAQAYVSAAMYFQARTSWHWGTIPALVVSVFLLAPTIGILLERFVFRHLRTAAPVAKLVVTIGLSVALPALFDLLIKFEPVAGQTPVGILPKGEDVFYGPRDSGLSRDAVAMLVIALVAMALLGLVFRYTAIGARMRAVVESPRMTELNGIRADRISAGSWALSSLFAGLAGVLIAPLPQFNTLNPSMFFNLLVVAITAAAIGRLTSLSLTFAGGLGLGVLIAIFHTFQDRIGKIPVLSGISDNLSPAMPFVVLFGVLVFWPAIRNSKAVTDPLAGVDPPPPAPAALTRSRGLTIATRVFAVVFFALAGSVVWFRADPNWMNLVTQAVILSVIFLSITVITGLAGEVSLCQGTFAAIGAFTTFQFASRWGTSVLVGALVGALIAAAVGAILSLPVLRLGGIWLSIATLAFAYFFDSVMVKFSWVGGGPTAQLQGTRVPRPALGMFNMNDGRSFLVLCVIVLLVVALAVVRIRGGSTGQTLRALRGSQIGAQSIGISPGRARIVAFTVSAFIAGLGGALLAMLQQDVNYPSNFSPVPALFWLVLVVSLGARTVEGAMQAGAAFGLVDAVILSGAGAGWILRTQTHIPSIFPLSSTWTFVLFGLGALQFARHPEGLVENGKRQATARVDGWIAALRSRSGGVSTGDAEPAA